MVAMGARASSSASVAAGLVYELKKHLMHNLVEWNCGATVECKANDTRRKPFPSLLFSLFFLRFFFFNIRKLNRAKPCKCHMKMVWIYCVWSDVHERESKGESDCEWLYLIRICIFMRALSTVDYMVDLVCVCVCVTSSVVVGNSNENFRRFGRLSFIFSNFE